MKKTLNNKGDKKTNEQIISIDPGDEEITISFKIKKKYAQHVEHSFHKLIKVLEKNIQIVTVDSCCFYCERPFSTQLKKTIDHIVPKAYGGNNSKKNKVYACYDCNIMKGSRSIKGVFLKLLDFEPEFEEHFKKIYGNSDDKLRKIILKNCKILSDYVLANDYDLSLRVKHY